MVQHLLFLLLFSLGVLIFLEINKRFLLLSFLSSLLIVVFFNHFAQTKTWTTFVWIKTYSVIIPIVLLSLFQLCHSQTNSHAKKVATIGRKYIIPILLVMNICEATIADFYLGNGFNGFVGIVLIASMPIGREQWSYYKNILGFTAYSAWPILYSIWNVHFLLANALTIKLNAGLLPSILILVLAIIYVILYKKWHLWLMARAYSLYLFCLIGAFNSKLYPQIAYAGLSYKLSIIIYFTSVLSIAYLGYVYSNNKVNCLGASILWKIIGKVSS